MFQNTKTTNKLTALLLVFVMLLSLVPGMSLTAYAASTTVTWNASDIVPEHPWDESFTKDGITITAATCDFEQLTFGGGGTFTTTLGNFTKIEISADYAGDVSGTGWSNDGWQSATWTGNAASVSFSGDIWGGGMTCSGGNLTIKFTIEPVYYSVTINPGSNMTKTDASGAASQTDLSSAIADVVYTADEGYYFSKDYSVPAVNGITVTRNSYTQITVSGKPTADAVINLTAPTAKTAPAAPTIAAEALAPTITDGKITATKILHYAGKEWYVIASGDKGVQIASDAVTRQDGETTLVLLARELWGSGTYGSYGDYNNSTLKTTIEGLVTSEKIGSYYTGDDAWQNDLIAKRTLAGGGTFWNDSGNYTKDNIMGDPIMDATLWPLSGAEALQMFDFSTSRATYTDAFGNVFGWFLRNPGRDSGNFPCTIVWNNVEQWTSGWFLGAKMPFDTFGVRPALCLNLTDAILAIETFGGSGEYELMLSPHQLLTTITATGDKQASYSTANVANVSFNTTAHGQLSYLANWGWWGYGWTATVAPANGYTITKCVFYDDANRTATDSEAPFVVETTEEDKTPKVNGTPILADKSKGIKKIEVYGYATPAHTHDFTYSASGATITATCGEGCDITEGLTLTISAPTGDLTADGTKTFPATLSTGYNTTAFPGTYAITYTKDGAEFTGTPTEAGEYTASVTVGTATASVSYTVYASKDTQTITASDVTATYGDTNKSVSATTNGNGEISYAVKDGGADYIDVDASTGALTIKKVGTATVIVTAAETATYSQATKEVTVTINKANPTYTVPTGLTATYGDTLGGVTLPTGWAWANGSQSVGNAGTNTFKANFTPSDTANYNTVSNVDVSVTVNKATPSYTVPSGLTATYGDTLGGVTLPTGWSWADGTQSVGNAGTKTFKATFTPADTTNYNTVSNIDVTVKVNKASPSYTVPTGLTATYGDTLSTVTLPEGWAWVDGSQKVGNAGTNTFKATFTPADTANYNTVSDVNVSVTVGKANPTYTVPTGLTATYGQTLANVTLPTGWAWVDGTQSVGNAGTNTFKANFTPADTVNYNTVSNVNVSVTVGKANPTYTVPTGLTATYGQTLANVTLPTGWSWVNGTASVGNVGTNSFKANFTPADTANYNTVSDVNVSVTVGKANPTYTVPTGLTATYGDTLSGVTLPTGWAWLDSTQSVGNIGTNTFKATFTPTDTTNYNTISDIEVKVTVSKAAGKEAVISTDTMSYTSDSIYIEGVAGQEYVIVPKGTAVTDADWNTSVKPDPERDNWVFFENLKEATEFEIYTRTAATETAFASDAVKANVYTTLSSIGYDYDSTLVGASITVEPESNVEGLTYKWYQDEVTEYGEGAIHHNLTEIPGATGSTYTFRAEDAGKNIAVKIFSGDSEVGDFATDAPVASTAKVIFESNGGSDVETLTDAAYQSKIKAPADPTREGFAFDGWYWDEEFETPFDFEKDVITWTETTLYAKWTPNDYKITSVTGLTGANNKQWTKGTKDGVVITVKVSGEDDSFDHFVGVKLDGVELVIDVDYTVKKGSTIVTLTPATLEKLTVGEHTVTVLFDNGEVNTALTVLAANSQDATSPQTGDNSHMGLWIALMMFSLCGLAATFFIGKKKRVFGR